MSEKIYHISLRQVSDNATWMRSVLETSQNYADRNTNTRKCGLDLRSETVNVKWIDEFDSAGDKVALIGSYPFSLADTYNPEVSAKLILDIIKNTRLSQLYFGHQSLSRQC